MMGVFGRHKQKAWFDKLMADERAHFAAVYGRRRVGKTFLITKYFNEKYTFFHTGIANVDMATQLAQFFVSLKKYGDTNVEQPATWFEAFQRLQELIEKSKDKKKVIFIDELPWLDTARSKFLPAFEHFWNHWASGQSNLFLVICGSATSYIINKIFSNKGGLHNRITARIKLEPFTLAETEEFLKAKGFVWNRYQILKAYMVMGGIPYYLEAMDKSQSIDQNIDALFFDKNGLLKQEFFHLYSSLFLNHERHIQIISALAKKKKGLTRTEIIKHTKLGNSGRLTAILEELELSDFLRKYQPYGKVRRESLYQLTDFYSMFYFFFIHKNNASAGDWLTKIDHPQQRAWAGNTFENICLLHVPQIKKALGISGVQTEQYSWRSTSYAGAQIDLVLDRRDEIVNLFEMKFSLNEYTITKKYSTELMNNKAQFIEQTKTKKAVFLSMLTTYGVKQNEYSGMVQNFLEADVLFED